MTVVTPLTELEILLRLASALAVGCAMGLNRDLKGKPAGVRTLGLVGLGTALATMSASGFVFDPASHADATSRAIQGIITGVGFLGAGVIFKENDSDRIRGLTTAASIWLTACLGMVCGIGAWRAGGIALVLAIALLAFGKKLERLARWLKPEKPEEES